MTEMKNLSELMEEKNANKMRDWIVYIAALAAILEFLFILLVWWGLTHG
jgi:hypothetical protein